MSVGARGLKRNLFARAILEGSVSTQILYSVHFTNTHTHTRILPRSSSPRSVCSGRRFSATGISTVPARHLTEWPWQSRRRMPSPAKRTRRRDSIVRGAVVETISIFSSIPSTTNQDGLIGNVAQRSGQVLMSPNYTARDDPVIDAGTIQRFGVVVGTRRRFVFSFLS